MTVSPRQLGELLRVRRLEHQRSDPALTLAVFSAKLGLSACDLLALERGLEFKLNEQSRHQLAELLRIDPEQLPQQSMAVGEDTQDPVQISSQCLERLLDQLAATA